MAQSDQVAASRALTTAKSLRRLAKNDMLSVFKGPALAQDSTQTMRQTFLAPAKQRSPTQDARAALESMWAIPFNAATKRPEIMELLKGFQDVPARLRGPLASRYLGSAKKRDRGAPDDRRNAARSFWLHVFLLQSGCCVYSNVYPKTCEGRDFRAMTLARLEEVGSGEHGVGRKTRKGSDMRRLVRVWASAWAAELGGMYPCCKRCNEMANALGVTSALIGKFMKYHRATQAVRKAQAAKARAVKAARR